MSGHLPTQRNFLSHPLIVGGLIVAALFLTVSSIRIVQRAHVIRSEQRALETTRAELEQQKLKLEARLENSNSPEIVERIAKEKLNLKNPGEEVVVVGRETNATSSSREEGFIARMLPNWISHFMEFLKR